MLRIYTQCINQQQRIERASEWKQTVYISLLDVCVNWVYLIFMNEKEDEKCECWEQKNMENKKEKATQRANAAKSQSVSR